MDLLETEKEDVENNFEKYWASFDRPTLYGQKKEFKETWLKSIEAFQPKKKWVKTSTIKRFLAAQAILMICSILLFFVVANSAPLAQIFVAFGAISLMTFSIVLGLVVGAIVVGMLAIDFI